MCMQPPGRTNKLNFIDAHMVVQHLLLLYHKREKNVISCRVHRKSPRSV